jgi:hypothetical protein
MLKLNNKNYLSIILYVKKYRSRHPAQKNNFVSFRILFFVFIDRNSRGGFIDLK